ncbi:MAG TPA: sterol desaturase family protein [Bryobacteraceae bacterium]|jgi:sterol desaturase/sphingolipid hydroxylase (fatty acid hydroxylase superfamily)|nr:sterol desaturase family protein [Bryobacteraceae bacterium]
MSAAEQGPWWYWAPFLGAFAVIGFWETFVPARASPVSTPRRWAANAILLAVANALQVVLLRTGSGAVAVAGEGLGIALLPRTQLPVAAQWAIAILILDLVRYLQHLLVHKVGFLWRIHQVHHSDPHYDVSTGVRFHPFEGLFLNGSYLLVIAVLAPPVFAVLSVEAAAGFQSMFAHANADLPARLNRLLRRFWITPNLHRIHHSIDPSEQNTNFGMLFPVWDLIFGTFRADSRLPAAAMEIGIQGFAVERASNVFTLLAMPFRRRA